MNISAISHRPTEEYVSVKQTNRIVMRIKTARGDIHTCKMYYWKRDSDKYKNRQSIIMQCVTRDDANDYFEGEICLSQTVYYLKYYFELVDTDGNTYWYHALGVSNKEPDDRYFDFLYANAGDIRNSPDWAKKCVYYQIFPERFRNGNPLNDPPNTVPWDSRPTRENYMGGDLQGIIEKLDYLSDLGINILYLTPIFQASFNHKYATIDYFAVDKQFGTLDDLKKLVQMCHAKGIRVLLDGVFNHCGFYFEPFQDVLKKGNDSEYKDWFLIESFPISTEPLNYACVGDCKWMPKLNMANPEVQDYFIEVGKYWIREANIDGWRIDVADEIESRFLERFSYELKREFKDILLIGETWGDGGKLLQGNRLDSVMNYLFKDAVTDWIARGCIGVSEFDHQLNRMLSIYPFGLAKFMYNLLDSHDTPRFLFECGGDKSLLRLAVGLQFTFVGCPVVYYGDEIGLTGDNDPDCRRPMPWDRNEWDNELLSWYRMLIEIRKNYPVFVEGDYRTIICNDAQQVFGFTRFNEEAEAYIVINRSHEAVHVTVPICKKAGVYQDLISGERFESISVSSEDHFYNDDINLYQYKLMVQIPGRSIRVLHSSPYTEYI